MGTRLRIVAEAPSRKGAERTTEVALREVERLDRMLSTWDPLSELSQVNTAPAGSRVPVSKELAALLAEAESWARRAGRAFDPTVGALVDAWDLRGAGRVPDEAELARAISATGPWVLDVEDAAAVRRSSSGWIDSGAFGKGAALRSAARILRPSDARRVLLDLGGQIWAAAPADEPWPVEVAHPIHRQKPAAHLEVAGVSVATSGASERPGHLLDPRTGRPAPAWGSVTVVSADPLEADVLATALYVMGPEAGLDWALAQPHMAALFLRPSETGVTASWTPAMERWLVEILKEDG